MTDLPPSQLSDPDLLAAARPAGWQRASRAVGCPVILAMSALAGKAASDAVASAAWAPLGWLVGALVFFAAAPILMAVISAISSRGKSGLEEALRQRVGQGDLIVTLGELAGELALIEPGQRGWVLLIRVARSDGQQSVQLRLDVRGDGDGPVGRIEAVRGPSLNLYARDLSSLERWQRASLDLSDPERWLARLDALDPEPLDRRGRGACSLKGALIRVADEHPARTFSGRVSADTPPGEAPAWDLARELLERLGWDPSMEPLSGS